MLSLFICSPEELVRKGGQFYNAYPVLYKNDDGEAVSLRYATGFPNVDDVELLLNFWRAKFIVLTIPVRLKVAILDFLLFEQQNLERDFNCYSFICEYKGAAWHEPRALTRESLQEHALDNWNLKRVWLKPKVGDVVFLLSGRHGEQRRYFHHAAIYIGFGLYISVWGYGGELEVTTLRQMHTWYDSTHAYVATPRQGG